TQPHAAVVRNGRGWGGLWGKETNRGILETRGSTQGKSFHFFSAYLAYFAVHFCFFGSDCASLRSSRLCGLIAVPFWIGASLPFEMSEGVRNQPPRTESSFFLA